MLGYVKCDTPELLVKHHRLYRAVYCGLCRSIKKNTTRALQPFLSYDFVFFAMLRMLATGEEMHLEKNGCLLHPFRRKEQRLADNASLRFASQISLILTTEKIRDDLVDKDTSFARRFLCALFFPFLKRSVHRLEKREPALTPLIQTLGQTLAEGRELERAGARLDDMCSNFAAVLTQAAIFGLDGDHRRLLSGIADPLGRFLYTLDALDDMERDRKNGAFNPLLYPSESGKIEEPALSQIDLVLSFYIKEMKLAFDLLDGEENLKTICENIITRGLPGEARRIIKPKMGDAK